MAVKLRELYQKFSEADALRVKEIEKTTDHDVKAIEYFLKEQLRKPELAALAGAVEMIHFGLTSQDINNTAIPLLLKSATADVLLAELHQHVVAPLHKLGTDWRDIPMLARTHGQPASPTRFGKELLVFVERLDRAIRMVRAVPHTGKFGGATGNFNAHHVAFPAVDWCAFADGLLAHLGLERQQYTTQIEHYDDLAALLDALKRINVILINLCRDMWTYISMEYLKQKIDHKQVGSSAMPHKVNPIDFENAEGNLGVANALLEHLSAKLPVSRLQRDLTDSTVLRNLGVPFAHSLVAFKSIARGLSKLLLNEERIRADLTDNYVVVSEGLQTVLRREGFDRPYETLKDLTRTNTHITQAAIEAFIDKLNVSDSVKRELKAITPFTYTGILPSKPALQPVDK